MYLDAKSPPLPEMVDGEEEWIVEEILDSKVINRKLRYLVKWEGFRTEHNSWKPWDDVHAPDLVAEFNWKHPGAARQVRAVDFSTIPFRVVPGRHSLEKRVDVRGHSFSPPSRSKSSLSIPSISVTPTYVIPQRR